MTAALLAVQPLVGLAYLVAVREEWVRPRVGVAMVLAACPIVAVLFAQRRGAALVTVATAEVAGAGVLAVLLGFALAVQSG